MHDPLHTQVLVYTNMSPELAQVTIKKPWLFITEHVHAHCIRTKQLAFKPQISKNTGIKDEIKSRSNFCLRADDVTKWK